MTFVWQDIRYAARILLRAPIFTLACILVLAIGIGANGSIFSLVDAALLRPLPFPSPNELVMLYERPPSFSRNRVSPLNYLDWSEQNHVFSSTAAVSGGGRALTSSTGGAEQIPGQAVSVSFFDVLGVRAIAGRTFSADEAKPGSQAVVLSERLWRSHFGADPKIVGSAIRLDGLPFTVIGIVPANFQLLYRADLWTPFPVRRSPEQRKMHYLQVIGRLKPNTTLDQARADMGVIADGIARLSPETNGGWGVTVLPLREALVGTQLRATSLALAGIAGFVLLMACANVANLMLARGASRSREIAVRASLGGSQARIFSQLFSESMLLAALGGIAGAALSWVIIRVGPTMLPAGTLPTGLNMQLDLRVIGFAGLVTIVTGVLFGLAPAFHARRVPLAEALRSGSRSATAGLGTFRAVLAAGEIVVAVLLVAGAGLMLRTLVSIYAVDPGYRAENVLTARVSLPLSRYPNQARLLAFYQSAEHELSMLPGVRSAAFGGSLPLQGRDIGQGFIVVGGEPGEESKQHAASYQIVGAAYFDALGIRLMSGREFSPHDTISSGPVCIVNEEFVHRYLAGRNPLGTRVNVQSMGPTGPLPVVREIVGVIQQVKADGLAATEESVEIYVPLTQNPWYSPSIVVRAAGNPATLATAVKAAIAHVDKDLPVTHIQTMDQLASESVAQPRFRAALIGTFAALALILAAVGVFGVLAFSVSQRTREFGVRMALGARTADIMRLVIGGGLKITIAGIAIGIAVAAALTRFLESLLFGVKPFDPVTFLAAPVILGSIALLACAAPALRASRVNPSIALRQD